jgi:hypothetical protein
MPALNLLPKPPPTNSAWIVTESTSMPRRLQRAREFAAHAERRLRAVPDLEVLAVPLRDAAVRLERTVRLHLGAVGAVCVTVGAGERPSSSASAGHSSSISPSAEQRARRRLQEVDVVLFGLVARRGSSRSRRARRAATCRRPRRSRRRRSAPCCRSPSARPRRRCRASCARFVEVEPGQLAARDRRAQDHRLQHAGERDVIRVLRAAAGLGEAVGAVDVGADVANGVLASHGGASPSAGSRCASRADPAGRRGRGSRR